MFRPLATRPSLRIILEMQASSNQDALPRQRVHYRLTMREEGLSVVLFDDDRYCLSPTTPLGSVAAAHEVMLFLTMRPGIGFPEELFAQHTRDQMAFLKAHAELLQLVVSNRWEDQEGDLRKRVSIEGEGKGLAPDAAAETQISVSAGPGASGF